MILSKDSNNNWTPTAGGSGTFIGTSAWAFCGVFSHGGALYAIASRSDFFVRPRFVLAA